MEDYVVGMPLWGLIVICGFVGGLVIGLAVIICRKCLLITRRKKVTMNPATINPATESDAQSCATKDNSELDFMDYLRNRNNLRHSLESSSSLNINAGMSYCNSGSLDDAELGLGLSQSGFQPSLTPMSSVIHIQDDSLGEAVAVSVLNNDQLSVSTRERFLELPAVAAAAATSPLVAEASLSLSRPVRSCKSRRSAASICLNTPVDPQSGCSADDDEIPLACLPSASEAQESQYLCKPPLSASHQPINPDASNQSSRTTKARNLHLLDTNLQRSNSPSASRRSSQNFLTLPYSNPVSPTTTTTTRKASKSLVSRPNKVPDKPQESRTRRRLSSVSDYQRVCDSYNRNTSHDSSRDDVSFDDDTPLAEIVIAAVQSKITQDKL